MCVRECMSLYVCVCESAYVCTLHMSAVLMLCQEEEQAALSDLLAHNEGSRALRPRSGPDGLRAALWPHLGFFCVGGGHPAAPESRPMA